jgi:Flp pilus assembly protein TadD
MKRFCVFLFAIVLLAVASGCASKKVVVVQQGGQTAGGADNQGLVIASHKLTENGKKFLRKGKYAQASQQFELAIEKDPTNWEAHYYLGLTYQQWKKHVDAVRCFRKSIDLHPQDKVWVSRVRVHIGVSFEYSGNYRDAEREYQLAMTLDPDNGEASHKWKSVSKKNKKEDKYKSKGGD